jgi:hypothetical protein
MKTSHREWCSTSMSTPLPMQLGGPNITRRRCAPVKSSWIAILCLSAVFFLCGRAVAAGVSSNGQNPRPHDALLAQIAGQMSVTRAGVAQQINASNGDLLATGYRLNTDDGQVELQMDSTVVRAWRLTNLLATTLTDTVTRFDLSQGSLHVRTFHLAAGRVVEIDTPNGVITATQPGDFRIDCYTGDGGTLVAVNSGEVQLSGPGVSELLGSNQSVRLTGTDPITAIALPMPGKDPFDIWSRQRDREMLSLPPGHR